MQFQSLIGLPIMGYINGGCCVYYPSNLFRNARSFENWRISSDIAQF